MTPADARYIVDHAQRIERRRARSLFRQLADWLAWHDQGPERFVALRPGADLASIVLAHRAEIVARAEGEERESQAESECT
jgi:hypothetical protein